MPETELYDPIKAYLTAQDYEVKGAVRAAAVVTCRGDEPPVIVALKTGFKVSLFHQCVEQFHLEHGSNPGSAHHRRA